MRGKVTPMGALKPHRIPSADLKSVKAIYDKVEGREERYELNLYIAGEDEPREPVAVAADAASAGGEEPDSSTSAEGSTNQ
jgi:succinate dehydrogenase / fumarate reductase, iron-sulfur subunit